MNSVGLGLVGLGTVGTGVVKILQQNRSNIIKRAGTDLRLVQFCDKTSKARPEIGLASKYIVQDYKKLLDDDSIDIIVELIGGYEPARTIILDALKAGKHVVTANKAVLAKYWDEILTTAAEHQRLVYFEAAVGGGIPVIQGLNEGLAANRIKKITGILNGTTNFILTQMEEKGLTFDAALKAAQAAGFAESDPTFDIQGTDSAHKLAILASLAFGSWVKISDIYCEGIAKLELFDMLVAEKEFGYGLKLLGIAKETDGKIEARVHPAFLPHDHPFSTVKDEYNAISIVGDASGDVMFYGKGAGQMAAASAVVSDILFLARHVAQGTAGKLPYVTYDAQKTPKFLDRDQVTSSYYLRINSLDQPGVLSKIAGILGNGGVSISSVYQPQTLEQMHLGEQARAMAGKGIPIILTTHAAQEGKIQKAVQQIDRLPFVKSNTVLIRIEE
jgi:homoserine dehydrogenase